MQKALKVSLSPPFVVKGQIVLGQLEAKGALGKLLCDRRGAAAVRDPAFSDVLSDRLAGLWDA